MVQIVICLPHQIVICPRFFDLIWSQAPIFIIGRLFLEYGKGRPWWVRERGESEGDRERVRQSEREKKKREEIETRD